MATAKTKKSTAKVIALNKATADPFLHRLLTSSGLDADDAERNGLRPVAQAAVNQFILDNKLGIPLNTAAIAHPSHDIHGNETGFRLRFDTPEKDHRYRGPSAENGGGASVNFPVVPGVDWKSIVSDPHATLVITEGERKSLSATKHLPAYPAIGLQGVWMFGSKKHNQSLLAPLAQIAWEGRLVLIVFDSDVASNPQVALALNRLAATLADRGALVRIVLLTASPTGDKRGVDDYLANPGGREELLAAYDAAELFGATDLHPIADFVAYLPDNKVIHLPSGAMWPTASVDRAVRPVHVQGWEPMFPSSWLAQNNAVNGLVWWPGQPQIIEGVALDHNGVSPSPRARIYNEYRPPAVITGKRNDVKPWLDHLHAIYGDDANHIGHWMAHRAQRPGEKINHGLLLGGAQGIGKDTLLAPLRLAVGPHNWREIQPHDLFGEFNPYLKSVVLRINELRDLGADRFEMYERTKPLLASPPEVLEVNEKHVKRVPVLNVTGAIATTNYRTDGLYLPADDRRWYVGWSNAESAAFGTDYFAKLYAWYEKGGMANVVAYLRALNISKFNPKAPPPRTAAWKAIVDANVDPGDGELSAVLEFLRTPKRGKTPLPLEAITLDMVVKAARDMRLPNTSEFVEELTSHRARRALRHRLERVGYVVCQNPNAESGRWTIGKVKQVVYVRKDLSPAAQIAAARRLAS